MGGFVLVVSSALSLAALGALLLLRTSATANGSRAAEADS
jgi:hypothetical protein